MLKTIATASFSKLVLGLALLAPVAYVGCNYSVTKQSGGGTPNNKLSPTDVPTFAQVNERIFTKYNCTTCHAARGEFDPSNYSEAVANLADIRAAVQPGARKPMPPAGPMDAADLSFLLGWIDNGAPLDKATPGSTPAPTPPPTPAPTPAATPLPGQDLPSYAQLSTMFISVKCLSCHDGFSADDMQSYSDFTKRIKGVKIRVNLPLSEKDHMPKVGPDNPQLTQSELDLLNAWIDGGAPENGAGKFQMPAASPAPDAPSTPAPPAPVPAPTAIPDPQPVPTAAPSPVPGNQGNVKPAPVGELLPSFASINANLFMTKCMPCHAPEKKAGQKFPLTDLAGLLQHDTKAASKDAVGSALIVSVTRTDKHRMPKAPREALTQNEVDVLKKWIELGCPQ